MLPKINYTIENGEFTIYGSSIPEDADEFYFPLIQHLELIVGGGRDLVFNFKLDYFNTASTRYITRILKLLKDLSRVAKVRVKWYYYHNDETIEELGRMYKELYVFPFYMIEVA